MDPSFVTMNFAHKFLEKEVHEIVDQTLNYLPTFLNSSNSGYFHSRNQTQSRSSRQIYLKVASFYPLHFQVQQASHHQITPSYQSFYQQIIYR